MYQPWRQCFYPILIPFQSLDVEVTADRMIGRRRCRAVRLSEVQETVTRVRRGVKQDMDDSLQ